MNLFMQILYMFALKVYFYVYGEEIVTLQCGRVVKSTTTMNDEVYTCICQEIIYKTVNRRMLNFTKTSRQYKVTMCPKDGTRITQETYPMLCPVFFRFTKYPHMLAIKAHYQNTYL